MFECQLFEKTPVFGQVPRVRELLTPELAGSNPKAYMAHFRRLDIDAQRQYLQALHTEQLKQHFDALGEAASMGLFLTVPPGLLEVTAGGASLGEASGGDMVAFQARALKLAQQLEAKAVSGMLTASLDQLGVLSETLAALSWSPKVVILAGDSGDELMPPSLGWAMRGTIADVGTFYMPNQPLPWDSRAAVEVQLREWATAAGAVLDVRVL